MERPFALTTQITSQDACFTYVDVEIRTVTAITDPVAFVTQAPTTAAVLADAGLSHGLYAYAAVLLSSSASSSGYVYLLAVQFSLTPVPGPLCPPTTAVVTSAEGGVQQLLIANSTPDVALGRVVVAVTDAVRLADTSGLAVNPVPCGIALVAGTAGQRIGVAVAGVVQAAITGLGVGVASAVGCNASGQLVRAADATCVPGFYVGDCDTTGILTIGIRLTPSVTDYQKLVWTQPTWDIDPVLGNDRNTGLLGQPIKTAAEQHRRVGSTHEIDFDPTSSTPKVKMTIRSSLLANDVLTIRLLVRPSASLFPGNDKIPYMVEGIPAPVGGTNTITSVRSFNHAGNVTWGINTGSSMATHVRLGRIAIQTNLVTAYPQAWWLAKDNDDGLGMVRVSYPTYISASDYVNGTNSGTFLVNDTFQLYDLPVVPRMHIEVLNNGFAFNMRRLRISAGFTHGAGSPTAVECAFDGFAWDGTHFALTNCQHGSLVTYGPASQPYYTFGLFLNSLILLQGKPEFQNYVMFQGHNQLVTDGGVRTHSHTRGFQVFDSPGDGWIVWPGDQLVFAGGMIGSGNAGYGLNVRRGGRVIVGGLGATGGQFFRQTGALGDMLIGGRTSGPALNTTNPYGWTADRAYTHANFNTSVAGGGFGQNIFDPTCPGSGIMLDT